MAGRSKPHKGRLDAVWLVAGTPRRAGSCTGQTLVPALNTVERDRRYRAVADLAINKTDYTRSTNTYITSGIRVEATLQQPELSPLFRDASCERRTLWWIPESRSSLLVSVDTPHPFWSRSFVELVSDNGEAFRRCCGSDEKVIVRSEWAISRRGACSYLVMETGRWSDWCDGAGDRGDMGGIMIWQCSRREYALMDFLFESIWNDIVLY